MSHIFFFHHESLTEKIKNKEREKWKEFTSWRRRREETNYFNRQLRDLVYCVLTCGRRPFILFLLVHMNMATNLFFPWIFYNVILLESCALRILGSLLCDCVVAVLESCQASDLDLGHARILIQLRWNDLVSSFLKLNCKFMIPQYFWDYCDYIQMSIKRTVIVDSYDL